MAESAWQCKSDDPEVKGAQVDLVISRGDRVTNLCEMKSMASDSHGIPVGMKSVDSRWTIPVGGMATALAGCGFVIA